MEALLTVRAVMARYSVSRDTVRKWMRQGAPVVRMGSNTARPRFDSMALENWLDQYREGEWKSI